MTLSFAGALSAAEAPPGTRLEIRLTSAVGSAASKPGQEVSAVTIAPAIANGAVAIAAGVKVAGHVKEASSGAKPDERSTLHLAFDEIEDSHGRKAKISARVVEVDNARESVDESGKVLGIVAAQTPSARLDQGINKVAQRYPELAGLLGAAKQSMVGETDPSIRYEPGVEMTIELTKPLVWTGDAALPPLAPVGPPKALIRLVSAQPFRTAAENPPRPSDMTNLMYIGAARDLTAAFQAAGWYQPQQLNEQSKMETFRAIVELRGYKEAPVSTLLLDGRPPDLVFEKLNNTFAQRHHLRIWRRPDTFNGKPVWVCAATHDIGIDYSEEHRTFIHRVDPRIDIERAKVANDLSYTGRLKGISLVDRPDLPRDGYNATGDRFQTDGRMAVLEF